MNCRCDKCGKLLFSGNWWEIAHLEYCPKCGMEISSQKMKELKKARNLYCIMILVLIIVVIIYGSFIVFG